MESFISCIRESNDILVVLGFTEPADVVDLEQQAVEVAEAEVAMVDGVIGPEDDDAKRKFYELLFGDEKFKSKLFRNTSILKRRNEHLMLIEEVKKAYAEKKNDRRQTYLFKPYAILNVDGEEKLINKNESGQSKPRIYTYTESLYNDMQREHLIIGHGGRDKFYKQRGKVKSK
jgi:hypothetical protein